MKTISLRLKYTIFISLIILIALSVTTGMILKNSINLVLENFIENGTPLVKLGVKNINTYNFNELTKTLDSEDPLYEPMRKSLYEIKQTSNAKYFYTMVPYNDKEYIYVVDGSCSPHDTENFSPIGTHETADNYGEPARICLRENKITHSGMEHQEGWGYLVTIYCPINFEGKAIGFLAADYDVTDLRQHMNYMMINAIVISIIILIVVFFVVRMFLKKLFDRMKKVSQSIQNIAEGKADLSEKIPVKAEDEIGNLVKNCNSLTDSLYKMISSIKESVSMLSETGKTLDFQTGTTIDSIMSAQATIADIDTKAKNQSQTSDALAVNGDKMNTAIGTLTDKIGTQVDAITRISESIEEMTSSIQSIDANVGQISKEYEDLVKDSENGQRVQKTVADKVQMIQEQAENLSQANTVITNIASRTNLLAMNAAIEAAHAGESGKGFAVVAGEIRSLAENSSTQSKSISELITNITNLITEIVSASNLSLSSFQSLGLKITEVQKMLEKIKAGVDEQQKGTRNLVESMDVVKSSSDSILSASDVMKTQSAEVVDQLGGLRNAAAEISDLVAGTQQTMGEITEEAEKSSSAAKENLQSSGKVFDLVENFKI